MRRPRHRGGMESGRNSQRKDSDKPANSEGKGAEARRGRVAVAGGGGGGAPGATGLTWQRFWKIEK